MSNGRTISAHLIALQILLDGHSSASLHVARNPFLNICKFRVTCPPER